MAAAALPRAPLAAAQPPARAHPERVRLGAFAALGLFAGLHWGALIQPAQGGDMFLSLLIALAGGGRAHRAPGTGWPEWQRRTAAGVVAFVLLILALLVAGVPLRMLGWHQWDDLVSGMYAGHQLHAGHHRALPRDRRVGAHGDPVRRDGAAGARRPAGLLAAARHDAGLPDRRGGGPRHPLRGPDHRARARLAVLRRRAVLHPPRRLPLARARALRPGGRRHGLRGGHGRSSGRSSRRGSGQHPAVVQLRERSPRSSSPPRPRRSRGRTATGR